METNEILSRIEALAPQVAAEHEAAQAAIDAKNVAEAALLTRTIEMAKPALRACSSKILQHKREGATNGMYKWEETEAFAWRGFLIAGGLDEDREPGDQNRGYYHGDSLYLTTDAKLMLVTWDGEWSNWQGEANEWTGEATEITAESACKRYELNELIAAILDALEKQASTRGEVTKSATERAQKLSAIVDLVKK